MTADGLVAAGVFYAFGLSLDPPSGLRTADPGPPAHPAAS